MKNIAKILLLAVWVLLAGCEKTLVDGEESSAKKTENNVVLQLSVFEQVPFETRSSQPVTQLCNRLNVAFFQNGEKVKTVSQKASDDSFGTVAVALEAGVYQLVVIGHNSDGSATISAVDKVTFPNNLVSDTFYYYGDLTVGNTPETYQLTLTRAVSMFRMELTKALPASAVKIRFYYTGGSSTFSPQAGYGCVDSRQTVMITLAEGQQTFDVYTFPHAETGVLKMTVSVYDANDQVLKERVFEQVPVTRNRITKYTGDFFGADAPSAADFLLSGESEWDGSDDYTF